MTLALTITPATRELQPVLHRLAQLYVHDMSEWFGNDVLPDGTYAYDTSRWWTQYRAVYLATNGAAPVGFAVMGSAEQWTGDASSYDMSEFFVLRKYRRLGVGAMLAHWLWSEHPGTWLVRVLASNAPAVPFWRKTVTAKVGQRHAQQQQIGEHHWHFLRFDSRHCAP